MSKKCLYCDTIIPDNTNICPNCGAVNEQNESVEITLPKKPKTIDQLELWYIEHGLPPENVTRFFIGKNVKEKRAFGIYKDETTGNFIVYKNKDNGERAIRYDGPNEAYAVHELYQKLKEEVERRKGITPSTKSIPSSKNKKKKKQNDEPPKWQQFLVVGFIIGCFYLMLTAGGSHSSNTGYYTYNNTHYYNYHNTWYYYDEIYDDWYVDNDVDDYFYNNYEDYYDSHDYSSEYDFMDFYDSDIYESLPSSYDDDDDGWWSSSYDDDDDYWDSNDYWDSSDSDWDSDW